MEIKEFKVGTRVHMNDEPEENVGTITALGCSRAHVSWDNGNSTDESLSDLTPIIPDNPRTRVGNLVPYWCKKATPADLAAYKGTPPAIVVDTFDCIDARSQRPALASNPIPPSEIFSKYPVDGSSGVLLQYAQLRLRRG